jgi:hypothetical protein
MSKRELSSASNVNARATDHHARPLDFVSEEIIGFSHGSCARYWRADELQTQFPAQVG